MKHLFTLALMALAMVSYSQKVKEKKGMITVDDKPFLESSCKSFFTAFPCNYNYTGKTDMAFSINVFKYPTREKKYINKEWVMVDSESSYFKYTFMDSDVEFFTRSIPKEIFKQMWTFKVFDYDGTLNKTNFDKFVKVYNETEASILSGSTRNSGNTIIINNNGGGNNDNNR